MRTRPLRPASLAAALAAALGLASLAAACNLITHIGDYQASSCPGTPCKLAAPQCGCPAGEACTIDETSAVVCRAPGLAGATESCSATNPCLEGLLCVQQGATGLCEKFCTTDADCTAPGGVCLGTLSDGHGGTIPDAMLCTDDCDPFTNEGCAAHGTSCQIGQVPGKSSYYTFCGPAGDLGQGEACDVTSKLCAPKLGCFDDSGQPECLAYCDLGSKQTCGTCAANVQPFIIGGTEIGVCF